MKPFSHLHVHTEYSLLDGLSRVKPFGHGTSLIEKIKNEQMDHVAITDHGNLYGIIDFYREAIREDIKPIIGCEVYVAHESMDIKNATEKSPYHLTLLAKNNIGYKNLLKLVSKGHLEGFYYKPRVDKKLLEEYGEGIIALSGCPNSQLSQAIVSNDISKAKNLAEWHNNVFDNFYLELQDHNYVDNLEMINKGLINLNKELDIPLVLTNDSHYVEKTDSEIQDLMICIQTNTNIMDEKRLRMEDQTYHIRSSKEMYGLFTELPEAYENSWKIGEMCDVTIDFDKVYLPEFPTPNNEGAFEYLTKLCMDGINERIPNYNSTYRERLEYELNVIKNAQFANYFLVVWDIAKETRRKNILFGVRGSAAASLVLYVLGITDIDPIAYRLVFERFLNYERKEMPDIDMDFQDDRRDEILQYVCEKYGSDHVAQIITFGTLKAKAALRDTGRALGMPYAEVDKVAKLIPFGINSLDEALASVKEIEILRDSDNNVKNLIEKAQKLEGVVRNAGTHAAGVVISKEPLTEVIPLQNAPRKTDTDVPVTQFPMGPIGDLGLLKMDFLGLGNLSILSKAIKIVKEIKNIDLSLPTIEIDNQAAFDLLGSGETTGVFQLEGSGMRRYIKELKPNSIAEISAMIALYRPGPMEHIETFIKTKHGEIEVEYIDPILEDILEETYGIIVYQDQVLLIVQALAGYSLGEADIFRKAMGKKVQEIMVTERVRFIEGALAKGHSKELAEKVFDLIEPFAGYAFNKAHSVSYAMIAYWTAYFKANYPVEYMTALLNCNLGNIEKVSSTIDECVRLHIPILPPSINKSDVYFVVEQNQENIPSIRFGLGSVKNVGYKPAESLIEWRNDNHQYENLEELCKHGNIHGINKRIMESLVKVGTFDCLEKRESILASLDRIVSMSQEQHRLNESGQTTMFDLFETEVERPLNAIYLNEAEPVSNSEINEWELELLGKVLTNNPLLDLATNNNHRINIFKRDLEGKNNTTLSIAGQIKSINYRFNNYDQEYATCEISMLGGDIEVYINQKLLEVFKPILLNNTYLLITGKLREIRDDLYNIRSSDLQLITTVENLKIPQLSIDQTTNATATKLNRNTPKETNGTIPHTIESNGNKPKETKRNSFLEITIKESTDPHLDNKILESIKNILLESEGDLDIHFAFTSQNKVTKIKMPEAFSIENTESNFEKLNEILNPYGGTVNLVKI
jgi:DNA polymerase-3 subunit alpha